MPVSVKWAGRLGNAVIKYSVARIIAEDNDLQLLSPFPWPHFIHATPCPSGASEVGKENFGEVIHLDDERLPNMTPGFYAGKSVIMDGYMQHQRLLWPYRDRIRSFFRAQSNEYEGDTDLIPLHCLHTNEDDLGIHVRLTDGATLGGMNHVVHPGWYDEILSKIAKEFKRIVVITDDPSARNMFDVFQKYGAEIKSRTVPEDYFELMSFKNIIMGPSTFSWTAAFLGKAERVWMHDPFITLPNVKIDWPGATKVRGGFINGRCW